jgi:hypothetical protein
MSLKKHFKILVLVALSFHVQAQISGENNPDNTPDNGKQPCERTEQIVTNPFAPATAPRLLGEVQRS